MKIEPLSDRVVLKLLNPKDKTKAGIILPEEAQEESHMATVIAVGNGKFTETGQLIKPSVEVGQTVLISGKWAGNNVTLDGVEYKIVNDSDILAVIKD